MVTMNSFNIRQMQMYAGLCLWQFCSHFKVKHPLIDQLLLHLMKLMTASDLPRWEQDGAFLDITGRGDPLPEEISLLLSPDNLHRFNALVENCVEVGLVDMYGAPTDKPANFLQRVMDILSDSNVPLPSPDMLIKCNTGADVWGEPIGNRELKEILDAYGVDIQLR